LIINFFQDMELSDDDMEADDGTTSHPEPRSSNAQPESTKDMRDVLESFYTDLATIDAPPSGIASLSSTPIGTPPLCVSPGPAHPEEVPVTSSGRIYGAPHQDVVPVTSSSSSVSDLHLVSSSREESHDERSNSPFRTADGEEHDRKKKKVRKK
jgi:hypothetical protein